MKTGLNLKIVINFNITREKKNWPKVVNTERRVHHRCNLLLLKLKLVFYFQVQQLKERIQSLKGDAYPVDFMRLIYAGSNVLSYFIVYSIFICLLQY